METTEVIRVGRECSPRFVWTTESENGTYWHGMSIMFLKSMLDHLPKLEFVYDFGPPSDLLPAVQALVDDKIDIDPELYNMFDWRYEYVDFAYPIMHEKLQIRIISGRQIDIAGQVINGVFDTLSYSLLITSTFILGILLWAFSRKKQSILGSVITATGVMLKQDLTNTSSEREAPIKALLMLYSLLFSCMYASVITALLAVKAETGKINKLEDLLLPKFQHLTIMGQLSLEPRFKEWPIYDSIKDRLSYYDFYATEDLPDYEKIMTDVVEGRQVLFEDSHNVEAFYGYDLPHEFTCKYPFASSIVSSDDALDGISLPSTWLYRKGFKYAEYFDKARMWYEAFGLFRDQLDMVFETEHAIFVPEIVNATCPAMEVLASYYSFCPSTFSDEPLTLEHISRLLWYYAYGIGIAVVVFIVELAIDRCN